MRPIADPSFKITAALLESQRTGKSIKIADLEDADKERRRRESIARQRELDDV